ncbi:MAG: hypothetical protein ACFFC7_28845 [Candidatus Hermodarchaeota archaeon]
MNTSYYWPPPQGTYQCVAGLVLFIIAVLALGLSSKSEPASDVAKEFFPLGADHR